MRRWRAAGVCAVILLLAASVSFSGRYTLEIVDSQGRPQTAYALYTHQGSRPNPVHPVSYEATPPTLIRTGSPGLLTIPRAVHVHRPFPIETHPELRIEMVYVPALHNAGGRMGGGYTASSAGLWEMDAIRRRAVVFDLSGDPEEWQETLSILSSVIRRLAFATPRDLDPAAASVLREIIGHYRAEYDAFLERWGNAPRGRPPMPLLFSEEETRRWAEAVDADLVRHPTWGDEIRHRYERQIGSLVDIEAGLPK